MKKINLLVAILFTILFGTIGTFHAQLLEKKTISLDLAKKIAAAAEVKAGENNLNVAIAIVDESGNLIFFERMDNAQLGSIEVAIQKARTSAFFKRPTKAYEERVSAGNNAILSLKDVLPFEGGIPLNINSMQVGAVGVSGGTPQQDGTVAQAAANFFKSL